jgi:hypothetical protein
MISPVNGNLGTPGAPPTALPAVRLSRPGWRDPRLWIGVLLVVVSVVAGARVLATADDTVGVWAAARDMGAGDNLAAGDLVVRRVRFGEAGGLDHYYPAGSELPSGLQLSRGVGAGELLPRAAVGPTGQDGIVQVPVAVAAELVPPSVGAGSVVDLYVLPSDGGRCPSGCAAVLEEVPVVAASARDEGFAATGQRQLVLGVTDDEAQRYLEVLGGTEAPLITVVGRG